MEAPVGKWNLFSPMTSNGFACGDCRPDFRPLTGTTNDLSVTFAYNPASQITQAVRTGDTYAYTTMGNGSTAYTQNGLNQQVTVGGSSTTHDANGNLTTEPQSGKTYAYSSENRLTSASGGVSVYYDPLGRIAEYDTNVSARFMSDGGEVAVEIDNPGSNIVRRFVRGDGPDELIAWYEGSGTTSRRFAGLDERGSIISATDGSGTLVGINAYDDYGKPAASNIGRMQYTGQMWLPEANLYYYKARNYAPQLGRFVQTDPIGPSGGINLYAYTGNDPVNAIDPSGLAQGTPGTTLLCGPDYFWSTATQSCQPIGPSFEVVGQGPDCGAISCYRIENPIGPGRTRDLLDCALSGDQTCPIFVHGRRPLPTNQSKPTLKAQPKITTPAKPKGSACYKGEPDSEAVGSIVGSAAFYTFEGPSVVGAGYAILRGARVAAAFSEFLGPYGLYGGLVIGGLAGGVAYVYDKETKGSLSRNMRGCGPR